MKKKVVIICGVQIAKNKNVANQKSIQKMNTSLNSTFQWVGRVRNTGVRKKIVGVLSGEKMVTGNAKIKLVFIINVLTVMEK